MARSELARWQAQPSWHDWHWQQAHRLRTAQTINALLPLLPEERDAFDRVAARYPVAVTPYYLSLIDPNDPQDPIRLQALPRAAELVESPGEQQDPQAEEAHSQVPGLTHRYPDRALLYVSHHCAVYCRHCFRKRKVGHAQSAPKWADYAAAIDYIAAHREVRDVLLSGGDPLTLCDARLERLLRGLRAIPHVEIIRVSTRNPTTLPQRITEALCAMLKRYQPIYVTTQFNHSNECTAEAAQALARLADAGLVLANQTVLLRGINDSADALRRLNHWLLAHRCRPYYLHQCDAALGLAHLRTTVAKGIEIMAALRGHTSGLALPCYVLDLPGGGGKAPLEPNYICGHQDGVLAVKSYNGNIYTYTEGPHAT